MPSGVASYSLSTTSPPSINVFACTNTFLGFAWRMTSGRIFVRGQVVKTVPEAQIVETLIEEAMRIAEEMGEAVEEAGEPTPAPGKVQVTVS